MDIDLGVFKLLSPREHTTIDLGYFIFKVFCYVSKTENFFRKDSRVTIFPLYKSGHCNCDGVPEVQVPT